MKRLPVIAWLAVTAALLLSPDAKAQSRATYEKMVAVHARANQVPEALVHRVIVRESKYHPDLIGRGGTIGLMQIKLATARGLGYQGDAEGLREPETNLTYGVKYLAGAYRAAESNHDRAVHLYASGYYEVARRQRLDRGEASRDGAGECAAERTGTTRVRAKGSGGGYRGSRRGRTGAGREAEGSHQAKGSRRPAQRPPRREAKTPCRSPRADAHTRKTEGGADALAQSGTEDVEEARGGQRAGSPTVCRHGCQHIRRCKRRTAALTLKPIGLH